jgi:anthranilate phosphoribosyltransferase
MGLRVKGESPDEVAGAARAMRGAMIHLPAERPDELVDTCGTGGGAMTTFNISTAAAFVAAGAGLRVAKHGNRSFTSQCGSADVLEALGIRIDASPSQMAHVLDHADIVFMFAPTMHPAMRFVGPVRRELAVPTVMNVLGPLANPAGAGRQVVGVSEERRLPLLAGALAALGARHAVVVYGEPGLDEISPLGTTRVADVRDGKVNEWTLDPAEVALRCDEPKDLAGGSPADNARIILEVLEGKGPPGANAAVLLNAAAALYVSADSVDFGGCVARARKAVESGSALAAVSRMREAYVAAAEVQ